MLLGGVTGHGGFARDSGVLLLPEEVVPAAVAILRLFIDQGDRTDRKRARLHYLVECWGLEKCLSEAAGHLPLAWRFAPLDICELRRPVAKHGHISVHPQSQPGLCYIGVVLPVGRLEASQLRRLADVAERYGSGTLRLTVWQNLLVSDVRETSIDAAVTAVRALRLGVSPSAVRGGIARARGAIGRG